MNVYQALLVVALLGTVRSTIAVDICGQATPTADASGVTVNVNDLTFAITGTPLYTCTCPTCSQALACNHLAGERQTYGLPVNSHASFRCGLGVSSDGPITEDATRMCFLCYVNTTRLTGMNAFGVPLLTRGLGAPMKLFPADMPAEEKRRKFNNLTSTIESMRVTKHFTMAWLLWAAVTDSKAISKHG